MLQTADGAVLGALAPFTVELPWWPEVADVVEAARRDHGVDVTVLRLLRAQADRDDPSGMAGRVTYAAEVRGPVPAALGAVDSRDVDARAAALDDHSLRLPWARPGGPAREVAWAEQALVTRGRAPSGPPRQIRSWNLSSIWSIPTAGGAVWLKSVPPFFAHEGAVIEWLADPALPPLIAAADGRVLLDDIPGEDQYDAPLPLLERAVGTLVAIQSRVAGRVDELFALGLPDWRWDALRVLVDDVVARHRHELDGSDQAALGDLVAGFARRCAAVDACGLPMTLVHGDFHRGNLRGGDGSLTLLDWGDCGIGHPLFDVAAMLQPLDPSWRGPLLSVWAREWRDRVPDADPQLAAALIEPIANLRQAVIYRGFLDAIEPSEHCYHEHDPGLWLRRAALSAEQFRRRELP